MGVDLKKEIKLSDLFKRRDKEPKQPKPEKEVKPPKTAKAKRRGAKTPQAAPQIPLMRAFNLMPKEDPRQAKGRHPTTVQIALALAAVLLIGALGSLFLMSSAGVTQKQARSDELRVELAALEVPSKEPQDEQAPELLDERKARTTALATALQARVAWDRLLREFALVLPEDVWLTGLTAKTAPPAAASPTPSAPASAQESSFTINGYTHDQEGVARLLSRLAVLPELSGVTLMSSSRVELGGQEVVQFSISASVKQGGGATA